MLLSNTAPPQTQFNNCSYHSPLKVALVNSFSFPSASSIHLSLLLCALRPTFLPGSIVWLLPTGALQGQTASVPRGQDSSRGPASVSDWEVRRRPKKGMGHTLERRDLVTCFDALTLKKRKKKVQHSLCLCCWINWLKKCTETGITKRCAHLTSSLLTYWCVFSIL